MKKALLVMAMIFSLIGCEKPSPEGKLTKDDVLSFIIDLDAEYNRFDRYVSDKILEASQVIKYDNFNHKESITSPAYKSWLVCYDIATVGVHKVLVFVNADTGQYSKKEIEASDIHITWDQKYTRSGTES